MRPQHVDKVLETLSTCFKLHIFRDTKYHEKSRFARQTPVLTGFLPELIVTRGGLLRAPSRSPQLLEGLSIFSIRGGQI